MLKFIFGIDGSFTGFMEKVGDLLLVSLSWMICSLLVVTIPLSSSALYYSVIKCVRKQRGTAVKEFWSFVKKNWKNGLVLGILYAVLAVLVGYNIYAVLQMDPASMLYKIYIVLSMWLGLCFIFLSIYLFPVFSRFDSTPWECLKMSILFSWRHVFSSLVMAVLIVPTVWFMMRYPAFMMIVPGVVMFFLTFRMEKILQKYMPVPENPDDLPWYYEETRFVQDDEKE